MSKAHFETTKTAGVIESLCGGHHYETHACSDGRGTNAVTGYGSSPEESRQDAADKLAAQQADKRA